MGANNLAKYKFIPRKRHEIRPSQANPLTECPSQAQAMFQAVPCRTMPYEDALNIVVRKYGNNGIDTDGNLEFESLRIKNTANVAKHPSPSLRCGCAFLRTLRRFPKNAEGYAKMSRVIAYGTPFYCILYVFCSVYAFNIAQTKFKPKKHCLRRRGMLTEAK